MICSILAITVFLIGGAICVAEIFLGTGKPTKLMSTVTLGATMLLCIFALFESSLVTAPEMLVLLGLQAPMNVLIYQVA